jgi:hypothetical protein
MKQQEAVGTTQFSFPPKLVCIHRSDLIRYFVGFFTRYSLPCLQFGSRLAERKPLLIIRCTMYIDLQIELMSLYLSDEKESIFSAVPMHLKIIRRLTYRRCHNMVSDLLLFLGASQKLSPMNGLWSVALAIRND